MENVPFTINKKQQNYEGNADLVLDQKLDLITAGAKPFLKDHLLTDFTRELFNYSRLYLIHAPSAFGLINEEYLGESEQEEHEEEAP